MGLFKPPVTSTLTWEAFSIFFYHTIWNSNSYFSAKLLVNQVSVLPIHNISVCADREKKKHNLDTPNRAVPLYPLGASAEALPIAVYFQNITIYFKSYWQPWDPQRGSAPVPHWGRQPPPDPSLVWGPPAPIAVYFQNITVYFKSYWQPWILHAERIVK